MTTTTALLIALLFALVGAWVVYLWFRLSTRRTVIEKTLTVGRTAIPRRRLSTFDEMWNLMESSMLESIRESTAVRETMEVEQKALDIGARVMPRRVEAHIQNPAPDGGPNHLSFPARPVWRTRFLHHRALQERVEARELRKFMAIKRISASALSGASEPLIQRLRDVVADAKRKPHATNLGAVRDTLDLIKAERALQAYDRSIERERRATTLPDGYEDVTGDAGLSGGPYAFKNLAGDIVAGYHTKRRMCLGAWNYYYHPEEFVPPEPYDPEEDRLVSLQVRTGLEVQADGRRGVTAVYDNVSLAWLGRFDEHITTATRDGAIPIGIEAFVDGKWVTKLRGVLHVTEASYVLPPIAEPLTSGSDVNARAEAETRENLRKAIALLNAQAESNRKMPKPREVVCATGEGAQ